jgi:hypothetical protein
MMLPIKFRFIWPSGFREDSLEINQSETRMAYILSVVSYILPVVNYILPVVIT